MQKSKTHFEQIPVALVKKIAKDGASDDNDEKDGADTTIATSNLQTHRLPSLRKNGKGLIIQLSKETKTEEDIRYSRMARALQTSSA